MDFLVKPWAHQRAAIDKASPLPGFAFFFEQGCGKTGATINTLRVKYAAEGRLMRTLILAPIIVLENWKKEFAIHSHVDPKKITVLSGTGKRRHSQLMRAITESDGDCIIVANYESLQIKDLFTTLESWRPEIVVCDESHRVKNPQAQRTKLATKLADHAIFRYIMTGTPILNTPMDIYSQFRILDGGERFGKNFYGFRATYFYDANAAFRSKHTYFPNWQIKPKSYEQISNKIFEIGMQVTKDECMDLPPLVRQEIQVAMLPAQEKAYRQMERDFIAFLGESTCVAQLALTKGLRLLEIVSGYFKSDDGAVTEFKENPREKALAELLEDIAPFHKVIVWSVFRQNYQAIRRVCDKLGLKYVEVTGDISNAEKFRNVDAFNSDDSVRVLIGNQAAGGIGIGLQAASYMVYYSRSFSLEHDLQSEARAHRGGSEIHDKITRIDLVSPGTIDELVLKKLAAKEEIGDSILQAFKDLPKNYGK